MSILGFSTGNTDPARRGLDRWIRDLREVLVERSGSVDPSEIVCPRCKADVNRRCKKSYLYHRERFVKARKTWAVRP